MLTRPSIPRSIARAVLAALAVVAAPAAVIAAGPVCAVCGHVHAGDSDGPATFRDSDRFTRTAEDGTFTSLSSRGVPANVTWSLVPDGSDIPEGVDEAAAPSNLIAWLDSRYGSGPGGSDLTQRPWFDQFASAFQRWEDLTGLDFTYDVDDGAGPFTAGQLGVRGDIRIGGHRIDGNSGTLAYNYYPDTADMVIDTDDSYFGNTGSNSIRLRNVVMHEVGHGIGLAHLQSGNSRHLMEPYIDTSFDGPQFDDILGAQHLYGDALEKGGGNDTAATATAAGTFGGGDTWAIGADAQAPGSNIEIAPTQTDFISIDDDSDTDFFRFTVTEAVYLDATLSPRGPTYNEGPQGGSQSSFNTAALSDLVLAVLDSLGAATLGLADATTAGSAEALTLGLDIGEYTVRVTGKTDSAIQMYRLDLAFADPTAGDATLDGAVDFSDFITVQAGFGGAGSFTDGDFDGSGVVDFSDFLILQANFGAGAAFTTAQLAAADAALDAFAAAHATVPEPANAAVFIPAALALLRRRRAS